MCVLSFEVAKQGILSFVSEGQTKFLTNVSSLTDEFSIVRQLSSDSKRLSYLESLIIHYLSTGMADNEEFKELRAYFIANLETRGLLPRWIRTFKSLAAIWEHIRMQGGTPEARKIYVQRSFEALRDYLIRSTQTQLPQVMQQLDNKGVKTDNSLWAKAKEKSWDNPDSAVTLAAMAFENKLQQLAHDLDENLDQDAKLGIYGLYQEIIKKLELFPTLQESVAFASVLDGMAEVVSGLDLLSMELGEQAEDRMTPGQAELTIKLAESISGFLSESVLAREELD